MTLTEKIIRCRARLLYLQYWRLKLIKIRKEAIARERQ